MTNWIENKYKNNVGYIPNMKSGTEWSMIDVFGEIPPYNPVLFSRLCPRTMWLGKCVEDVSGFCTECGTLTPDTPNTHHKGCNGYLETDTYPEVRPYLGGCPICHEDGDDNLSIGSNIDAGISMISCSECTFYYEDEMCEEDLEDKFLAGCK